MLEDSYKQRISQLDSNPDGKHKCELCGGLAHYMITEHTSTDSKRYVCETCASILV